MIYFKDIPEPVEYPQHKGKILTHVDLSEFLELELEPEPEPEPTIWRKVEYGWENENDSFIANEDFYKLVVKEAPYGSTLTTCDNIVL